jgi:hypothetical protein
VVIDDIHQKNYQNIMLQKLHKFKAETLATYSLASSTADNANRKTN